MEGASARRDMEQEGWRDEHAHPRYTTFSSSTPTCSIREVRIGKLATRESSAVSLSRVSYDKRDANVITSALVAFTKSPIYKHVIGRRMQRYCSGPQVQYCRGYERTWPWTFAKSQ